MADVNRRRGDCFGTDQSAAENRRAAIETLDVKNGYLEIKPKVWDGETGKAEIALFHRKNSAAVIAVSRTNCGMDDCGGNLSLLIYDGVKWTDATDNLMPKITAKIIIDAYNRIKTERDDALEPGLPPRIYFILPRLGTTVTVALGGSTAASDEPLFYLKWNKEKFDFSNIK